MTHKQVIKDEADAEQRYIAAVKLAAQHARELAADAAKTLTERAAAEEAAKAHERVEAARQVAREARDAEDAKRSFWSWLTG